MIETTLMVSWEFKCILKHLEIEHSYSNLEFLN